jgi:hypothetical protein
MKKTGQILILSLLLSLIPIHTFAAESSETSVSSIADVTLIEGKVKRYNQETKTVLLQLKSGEKISVVVDWNTDLVGYSSPEEIEKNHLVKIWHSNDGQKAKAVKVEKKLMVGC